MQEALDTIGLLMLKLQKPCQSDNVSELVKYSRGVICEEGGEELVSLVRARSSDLVSEDVCRRIAAKVVVDATTHSSPASPQHNPAQQIARLLFQDSYSQQLAALSHFVMQNYSEVMLVKPPSPDTSSTLDTAGVTGDNKKDLWSPQVSRLPGAPPGSPHQPVADGVASQSHDASAPHPHPHPHPQLQPHPHPHPQLQPQLQPHPQPHPQPQRSRKIKHRRRKVKADDVSSVVARVVEVDEAEGPGVCGWCQEPLDQIWDDARHCWVYRDTIRILSAALAALVGLMSGAKGHEGCCPGDYLPFVRSLPRRNSTQHLPSDHQNIQPLTTLDPEPATPDHAQLVPSSQGLDSNTSCQTDHPPALKNIDMDAHQSNAIPQSLAINSQPFSPQSCTETHSPRLPDSPACEDSLSYLSTKNTGTTLHVGGQNSISPAVSPLSEVAVQMPAHDDDVNASTQCNSDMTASSRMRFPQACQESHIQAETRDNSEDSTGFCSLALPSCRASLQQVFQICLDCSELGRCSCESEPLKPAAPRSAFAHSAAHFIEAVKAQWCGGKICLDCGDFGHLEGSPLCPTEAFSRGSWPFFRKAWEFWKADSVLISATHPEEDTHVPPPDFVFKNPDCLKLLYAPTCPTDPFTERGAYPATVSGDLLSETNVKEGTSTEIIAFPTISQPRTHIQDTVETQLSDSGKFPDPNSLDQENISLQESQNSKPLGSCMREFGEVRNELSTLGSCISEFPVMGDCAAELPTSTSASLASQPVQSHLKVADAALKSEHSPQPVDGNTLKRKRKENPEQSEEILQGCELLVERKKVMNSKPSAGNTFIERSVGIDEGFDADIVSEADRNSNVSKEQQQQQINQDCRKLSETRYMEKFLKKMYKKCNGDYTKSEGAMSLLQVSLQPLIQTNLCAALLTIYCVGGWSLVEKKYLPVKEYFKGETTPASLAIVALIGVHSGQKEKARLWLHDMMATIESHWKSHELIHAVQSLLGDSTIPHVNK